MAASKDWFVAVKGKTAEGPMTHREARRRAKDLNTITSNARHAELVRKKDGKEIARVRPRFPELRR